MRKITWVLMGLIMLALVHGCGECGVVAAAAALGTDLKIGNLTACQLQTLYTDGPGIAEALGITELSQYTLPELTDEQAQTIVDFLDEHNIVTATDLQVQVESGELTVEDLPESLRDFYLQFLTANL